MIDLDKLDLGIIDILGVDARVSNRQIAGMLGVTEGTIRTRVRRLQEQELIRFTLVTDFRMAGSPNLVMLGIRAEPPLVRDLADTLSKMDAINCVIVMLGRYSILAMGLFKAVEEVNQLVRDRITPLKGIQSVEFSFAVRTLKYDARKARIKSGRLRESGSGTTA